MVVGEIVGEGLTESGGGKFVFAVWVIATVRSEILSCLIQACLGLRQARELFGMPSDIAFELRGLARNERARRVGRGSAQDSTNRDEMTRVERGAHCGIGQAERVP